MFYTEADGSKMQQYEVTHVEVIQNRRLYDAFMGTKQNVQNEVWAWHGAEQLDTINKIKVNGFLSEFNIRHLLGKGNYFSCDTRYVLNLLPRLSCIFLSRVLRGTSCKGDPSFDFPQFDSNGKAYDSYSGELYNGNGYSYTPNAEIIVLPISNNQALPEFLVHFKRK